MLYYAGGCYKNLGFHYLSGEHLTYATANREDNARTDISADGFWTGNQRAFFDVRIFNPNAPSYHTQKIEALYRKQEKEKRRTYEQRITEIEMGSFSPLVFSVTGGMGRSTTVAYQRLALLLSEKKKEPYNQVISWMRCRLSFSLLRSAISAIRNTRSSYRAKIPDSLTLANLDSQ